MDDATDGFGIVVTDAEGQVRFRSGLGGDPAVADILSRRRGRKTAGTRRLDTIDVGGRRLTVLTRRSADATLHVIHEARPEETLTDFVASVDFAYAILNHFVNSPFEAVTVVDADARVRYLSPVHEKFFGLRPGEAIGKAVTDVIENTRLHEVVRSGKPEIGHVQEMRGVTRVVSRQPIFDGGRVVGAIGQVMFRGPEQLHALSRELTRLRSEVAYYRRELSGRQNRTYGLDHIVGNSDVIRQLKADIVRVASLDMPVLLIGESGTGKELAAHAIHSLSPRHERPMVLVNAAALPATLVESELFGYEPGAFTGAERKGRKGKFEQADRSSLFLDEIGDMPMEMQAKLLRVLQDGMFERVGGDRPRHSDFRLVSATNRDLKDLIDNGRFRLDLYYRLSGVVLRMPALAERLDDIPAIVESFLVDHAGRHGLRTWRVHPDVYAYLRGLPWPGNVRQLLHEVERATVFAEGGEITVAAFRPAVNRLTSSVLPAVAGRGGPSVTVDTAKDEIERRLIREAMVRHGGNKKRVAEELGISRSYLYKRLQAV